MTQILDLVIALLLAVGGLFALIGAIGMLKLRDTMQRLHAPTKATTIGVGTALIGSAFHGLLSGAGVSWHELLITLFLLVTAPVSALYLAKAQMFGRVDRGTLPPRPAETPWATLQPEAEQKRG
jgi:multicomponent K+:H+ antiporter subunit G